MWEMNGSKSTTFSTGAVYKAIKHHNPLPKPPLLRMCLLFASLAQHWKSIRTNHLLIMGPNSHRSSSSIRAVTCKAPPSLRVAEHYLLHLNEMLGCIGKRIVHRIPSPTLSAPTSERAPRDFPPTYSNCGIGDPLDGDLHRSSFLPTWKAL
ncbi:LOW QUALITY PROTEIN: hypothetical protein HID58_002615 [Brassica napus]|uniref:Uncharacterized protein n=1 Tax=Brassica napus TaxID=3708 RepID=A0ABQ8ENA6_BRANA|nr:LOW QUALITY PROTEIN: hypothetical protein HID58_002615 [Brassica napus]